MQFGKLDVSRSLMEARREGRLAVFAGAGVSKGPPAERESFQGIANRIETQTGIARGDTSIEQYLGRLENQGVPVHRMTRKILTEGDAKPTDLHQSLLKLFGDVENVRVITTNYDRLFSDAAEEIGWNVPVYEAPALPQGDQFAGLIHIHGSFRQPDDQLVLTDRDFSEAYLTEGWARRFLQQLFSEYVVLFVGYSHGDDVMRYLARGIPAEAAQGRYAFDRKWLEGDEKADRASFWDFYGVEAELYPEGSNSKHEELPWALQKWTDFANKPPSDRERCVQDLVDQEPYSLNDSEQEYLREMLRTPEGIRYFARHAGTFGWVQWMDDQGGLDSLFDQGDLGDPQEELAIWIADFLAKRSERVLALVSDKWTGLNPGLARTISHRLYKNRKEGGIAEETLVKWILLVLDETQKFPDFIVKLFRESIYPKDTHLLKVLLYRLTELVINVYEFPNFSDDGKNKARTLSDLEFRGGVQSGLKHAIRDVWKATLQPKLDEFASTIESLVTDRLLEASNVLSATGARSEQYADAISRRWREPGETEQIEDVDCLVNMGLDLVDWLIENRPEKVLCVLDRWRDTDAPILNLLATYALKETNLLDSNEKIERVLEEEWLLDPGLHPRSSQVIISAWTTSQGDSRQEVVQYLLRHLEDEDRERKKRYWFQIRDLIEDLEQDENADSVLQPVKDALADVRDSVKGDLDNQSGETQDETFNSADLDFETDLGFILDRFASPEGMLEKREAEEDLEQETRKNPEWTLDLAEKLAAEKRWDEAVWPYIFTAWERVDQPAQAWSQLLSFLRSHSALHERYAPQIARLLKKQGDTDDGAIPEGGLEDAIGLADSIWDQIASAATDADDSSSLAERLKRHPITDLIQFYEEAHLSRGGDHVPQGFREKMERLAEDSSIAAQAGLYELMDRATWIHINEPAWSRSFLIPLLNWEDKLLATAAWSGLLEYHGLQDELIVDLADEFRATFQHLHVFDDRLQEKLIEKIAQAAYHRRIDPMHDAWIDHFLKKATEEQARHFAQEIRTLLYKSNAAQIDRVWRDWLKEYMKRRRDSIPTPLRAQERKAIIRWFSQLGPAFSEAVDIFASKLSSEVDLESPFEVFTQLDRSGAGSRHPRAICDLVRHLIRGRSSIPRMHRQHVANLLKEIAEVEQDVHALNEVMEQAIRLGCMTADQKQEWLSSGAAERDNSQQ